VLVVPHTPFHHTFGTVYILLVDCYSHTMGSKTYVQLLSYNYVKTQIITPILCSKLWGKRGMQVDGLVLVVPDTPTNHTFVTVFIMLVEWYSHRRRSKTYVQLVS
jgi:hypothetical protein